MAHFTLPKRITTNMNMCEGPLLPKIIAFAIPLFISSVLQLVFNTADLIVVGRYGSAISVGAVGATSSLVHLIINLFIGLASGVGVVAARSVGAKDDEAVSKTVHTAIPLSIVCGIIINILMFFMAEPMLRFMETPPEVLKLSAMYLKIYSFSMIPTMIYNFSASLLRAFGDTAKPLMFLTMAGVINVILNLIFVIAFSMDVAGVALATTISQILPAILIILELRKRKGSQHLTLRKIRFHIKEIKRIISIGVPAGIQGITFSISNVIIQSSVNSFGAIAVSGSAAAASIGTYVYAGVDAFQQTALNFTGQNYGAKKIDRIRKVLLLCILCVVVTEVVLGGGTYLLAKPLLSLYIPNSPEAIVFGKGRMLMISLCYFIAGIMQVFSNVIRGMGHSKSPMLISLFANCVFRIFWIFCVFANFRQSKYAWEILFASYPISWSTAIILGLIVYLHIMKKNKKLLN